MPGHRPITIVEMRPRRCALTYGEGACPAVLGVTGAAKCYNTRKTCQAIEAFDEFTQALQFSDNVDDVPPHWNIIPSLRGVNVKPTKLNVAGLSASAGALGLRATVSLTFADHPDGDTLTDPYVAERGYDPSSQGTFWGKWLARNDDWQDIEITVLDGVAGQPLEDFTSRTYLFESVDGPDASGTVTVTGRDILSRADDRKAQAPRPSTGTLLAAINASAGTITLTGALATDYPAPGAVRIGREIITFTGSSFSSGITTLTGCSRGQHGTTAASHAAEATAQTCLVYTDWPPHEIITNLLTVHAGIPSIWIPFGEWSAEADRWLQPYNELSAVISQPTGVTTLLGELAESCMLYLWVDEKAQRIRLRAVRPPEGGVRPLTDEGHILAGSMSRTTDMDQQVSACEVYHGLIDPTENVDEPRNYQAVRLVVGEQFGLPRVRRIFSRWLKTGLQASLTAQTLLRQASAIPVTVGLRVGFKDMDIQTGDVVRLATRIVQDAEGRPLEALYQVIEARESQGESLALTLQSYGTFPAASYWMADDAPVHGSASPEEREAGCWWADEDGLISGNPSSYVWA